LSELDRFFAAGEPRHLILGGAPEGHDSNLLGGLVKRGTIGTLLHICADDTRMARLAAMLEFFHPGIEVLNFPSWDCLPYDRVSPSPDIVSRRIDTLTRLAETEKTSGRIVLTTLNAALQRVPPRAAFRERVLRLSVGQRIALDRLVEFLARNGYGRSETVREPGEFAIRGGIADLYPTGLAAPVRLDFFGDAIEAIRSFDPLTQRTTGNLEGLRVLPVSEVLFDEDSIRRFRAGYREQFGTVADDDPLYESVSAGHRFAGMEHWLPLYYERLETLFDYLPGAVVGFDPQIDSVRHERLEAIADFFEARRAAPSAGGQRYRPVRPEQFTIEEREWQTLLRKRQTIVLNPFAAPDEPATLDAGGRPIAGFVEARNDPKRNLFDAVRDRLGAERQAGRRVLIVAYSNGSADRLESVLHEHGVATPSRVADWAAFEALPDRSIGSAVLPIERGYSTARETILTEQDILGERLARPARRRARSEHFIAEVEALQPGDLVVHIDHGLGRYGGLETLDVAGAPHDCLRLYYAGDDKLYVPVENIEMLSRYGAEAAEAQLDKLGGVGWQSRKARVKARIKDMAAELIAVAAQRQIKQGEIMPLPQGLYEEFAARFPFPETEDQDRAIADTLTDIGSGKPMDRLICGDVGFGKTEVALRAAFIAVMAGTQVAVVVPTTLLARQHYQRFTERFAGMPVRIAQLSRLVSPREAADTKKELAEGRIDIVIGTHALLAKGVTFRHLGLLVIDEEQHFGVAQKEKLKKLKADVHVLTLTATPIPRTLQLALAGVRDMSVIATPPIDRLAIRSFVMPFDPIVLREAIQRERHRGGQVFVVVPRIADLDDIQRVLRTVIPDLKMAVAHGKLPASALEKVMAAFDRHEFDLLLSTDIIGSGLDIPTANTLIVHRAELFGLSQLYQLRGRIGRSKQRAFAYFTLPPGKLQSDAAQRRLEVMQTLDQLGAGFLLASHDLDIRGAGNLLGGEQSGHIREVGVELYQHLLEEAVADARSGGGEAGAEEWTPQITLGTPVLIPESYVADLNLRLGLYRRVAQLIDRGEIDAFAAELVDRFGKLPVEVENLLDTIAIKQLCRQAGVQKVEAGPKGAVLAFRGERFANPAGLVAFLQSQANTAKLRTDHRLVVQRQWDEPRERLRGVTNLMRQLADVAHKIPSGVLAAALH
jgi:transcription-repair coupling factor (superfamily II helicase)